MASNDASKRWGRGDFTVLAMPLMSGANDLVEVVDPSPVERVLDIACGSGNAALIAARRHCDTVGIDFVPSHIERAKQRAAAEGMTVDFRVANAQDLPFPEAAFDVVFSTFGIQFAPDQEQAASELLRVLKPGGRIGLANWTPDGWAGTLRRALNKYIYNDAPDARLHTYWGTDAGVKDLLGAQTKALQVENRSCFMHFKSLDHAIEVVGQCLGPVATAFEKVGPDREHEVRADLTEAIKTHDRGDGETVALECGYLRVLATRA